MIGRTALASALLAGMAFSQARPPATPVSRMEISLERLDVDTWRSVDPGLVLAAGDRIRFVLHPNFDAYLYVVDQSSSGRYEQLFPIPETNQANHLTPGNEFRVPAMPEGFRIGGPPGHETVYWLLSPAPLTDGPPHLVNGVPPSIPTCDETLLRSRGDCIDTSSGPKPVPRGPDLPPAWSDAAERSQRDLLFARRQDTTVVSLSAPLNAPVIYEFLLAHR